MDTPHSTYNILIDTFRKPDTSFPRTRTIIEHGVICSCLFSNTLAEIKIRTRFQEQRPHNYQVGVQPTTIMREHTPNAITTE